MQILSLLISLVAVPTILGLLQFYHANHPLYRVLFRQLRVLGSFLPLTILGLCMGNHSFFIEDSQRVYPIHLQTRVPY